MDYTNVREQGVLYRASWPGNSRKLHKVEQQLDLRMQGWTTNIDLQKYVKVQYTDGLERNHTEYFVNGLRDDHAGRDGFEWFNANESRLVDIDQLSAAHLALAIGHHR
jgi:hypothetical protein